MLSSRQALYFLCHKTAAETAPPSTLSSEAVSSRFSIPVSSVAAPGSSFSGDPWQHLKTLPSALRTNSPPTVPQQDKSGRVTGYHGLDAPFTPASHWKRPERPVNTYTGSYPVTLPPEATERGLSLAGPRAPSVSYAKFYGQPHDQVGFTNLLAQRALIGDILKTPQEYEMEKSLIAGDLTRKQEQQANANLNRLREQFNRKSYAAGVDPSVPGYVAETAYAMNSGDVPPDSALGSKWVYDKIREHGPAINDKQTDTQRETGLADWVKKLNDPKSTLGSMFRQWLNSRSTLTIRPDDVYKQAPDLSDVADHPRVQEFLAKLQGK